MANQVYANGREIACKAASGKSICAFPDVCFTPPQTPGTPPGVPIPYPNTGFASDTTGGSTTVKISGKEVMLKNKSYFKKSTGDEAGCAPKKGFLTSTNRGKVYFNAWSMDVKIEGENAVRHLDLTTHNHMSVPGDTPTWPYLDKMTLAEQTKACGREMIAVQRKCPNAGKLGHTDDDCQTYYASATKNAGYRNDPCVKAKRCMLVPYQRGKTQGGCCEGQTPHHLVPKHHFKDFRKYNENNAPCVCAEGYSWHRNDDSFFPKTKKTHPDMHDRQDGFERTAIDIVEAATARGEDTGGRTPDSAIDYYEARESGITAHDQTFKDSNCSPECMRAQLDAYHNQVGADDPDLLHTKKVGSKPDPAEADAFFDDVQSGCVKQGIFPMK